ncbi:MAG: YbhB/YbcL family Raf kinase inhibitor-like protein [Acidimicrobiia bacterium]
MRPATRPWIVAMVMAVAVIVAVVVAACGTSGRTLREPTPGATAPARQNTGSTSTTGGAGVSSTGGAVLRGTSFALTTTAWSRGGAIPRASTCDGADTSPPMTISGVPAGTAELVLLVTDRDRPARSLWILAGLGPSTSSLPQGGVPTGAVQIVNSSGTARWSGPCPIDGTGTYEFALHALTEPSGLTVDSTRAQVDAAVARSTSVSVVTGTYTRA